MAKKIHIIGAAMALAIAQTASGQDMANFAASLAGKDPAFTVTQLDVLPGSVGTSLNIRGIGSYSTGTLKFFVDGFEVEEDFVAYLSPDEVESVSILKNAAQLAVYGMNGANGVVLITTKRGTVGAPAISFRAGGGLQTPINVVKPLRSYDYASLYNCAYSNDGSREWNPYYDATALQAYRDGTGIDVDWYGEVLGKTAMSADGNLSIRGGSDKAGYFVSIDYANQQGYLNAANTDRTRNISFVKYGLRTNLDMKLGDILSAGVDIGGRLEDRTRPNYSIYSLMENVMGYPSNIYPVHDHLATDPISDYSGTAVYPDNPVGSILGLGWTSSRTKFMQANFRFREDLGALIEGLYLQESFSFYSKTIGNMAKTSNYARYFGGVAQTSDQSSYIRSESFRSSGKERWTQGALTLGWTGSFEGHDLSAKLNAHISDFNGNGTVSYDWKYRYANYSGTFTWGYSGRYDATIGASLFGSDAYAPGHRHVAYPMLSLGWTLSNESFLKDNAVVRYLKLRSSAGYTGSTEAYVGIDGFTTGGRYLYSQYYTWTGSFVTGMGPGFGGGVSGIRPLFEANPDVTAEKSLKADIGVDAKLWNKLSVTVEGFYDYRSGILTLDGSIPDYMATAAKYSNMGRMVNRGVDGSIVFSDRAGELEYSLNAGFLIAANKVLEMGEAGVKYPYNASTGLPYGARMGLECTGFYEMTDFDLDGGLNMGLPVPLYGDVQPGDLKYKDQDEDGYIDGTDIVCIGRPSYPLASYSFGASASFRGFDFSILFTGTAGSTVNLLDYAAWRPFENYGTAFDWAKGAWVYYPEAGFDNRSEATFPRLSTGQNAHNYYASSFWIRSNNYLRLRNAEIGYNIPVRKGIDKLRVFLSGYNLLTFSSLLRETKMDPEAVGYGYPASRSVNVGIQLSF